MTLRHNWRPSPSRNSHRSSNVSNSHSKRSPTSKHGDGFQIHGRASKNTIRRSQMSRHNINAIAQEVAKQQQISHHPPQKSARIRPSASSGRTPGAYQHGQREQNSHSISQAPAKSKSNPTSTASTQEPPKPPTSTPQPKPEPPRYFQAAWPASTDGHSLDSRVTNQTRKVLWQKRFGKMTKGDKPTRSDESRKAGESAALEWNWPAYGLLTAYEKLILNGSLSKNDIENPRPLDGSITPADREQMFWRDNEKRLDQLTAAPQALCMKRIAQEILCFRLGFPSYSMLTNKEREEVDGLAELSQILAEHRLQTFKQRLQTWSASVTAKKNEVLVRGDEYITKDKEAKESRKQFEIQKLRGYNGMRGWSQTKDAEAAVAMKENEAHFAKIRYEETIPVHRELASQQAEFEAEADRLGVVWEECCGLKRLAKKATTAGIVNGAKKRSFDEISAESNDNSIDKAGHHANGVNPEHTTKKRKQSHQDSSDDDAEFAVIQVESDSIESNDSTTSSPTAKTDKDSTDNIESSDATSMPQSPPDRSDDFNAAQLAILEDIEAHLAIKPTYTTERTQNSPSLIPGLGEKESTKKRSHDDFADGQWVESRPEKIRVLGTNKQPVRVAQAPPEKPEADDQPKYGVTEDPMELTMWHRKFAFPKSSVERLAQLSTERAANRTSGSAFAQVNGLRQESLLFVDNLEPNSGFTETSITVANAAAGPHRVLNEQSGSSPNLPPD